MDIKLAEESVTSIYIIESTWKTEVVSVSEMVVPVCQSTRRHMSEGSSQKYFHKC